MGSDSVDGSKKSTFGWASNSTSVCVGLSERGRLETNPSSAKITPIISARIINYFIAVRTCTFMLHIFVVFYGQKSIITDFKKNVSQNIIPFCF